MDDKEFLQKLYIGFLTLFVEEMKRIIEEKDIKQISLGKHTFIRADALINKRVPNI